MLVRDRESLKSRAVKWLLTFLLQVCAVGLAFGGTLVRDCFEVIPGSLPHIAFSKNKAIDFAIDSYGSKGWLVTQHCSRGVAFVANANAGDVVNDSLFKNNWYSVDGSATATFTFAFRWSCQVNTSTTIYSYGWVTLGMSGDELTILASAVSDAADMAVVDYGKSGEVEARPDLSEWKATDCGEWMELKAGCIPSATEGLVIIPSEIGGKPVRVIGNDAFAGCPRVTDIRIPNTVRKIGKYAFGCPQLKTVNLPTALEEIGDGAFSECVSLLSLELPAALSTIGKGVFPQGRALVVHLPKAESARLLRLIGTISDQEDEFDPPEVTFAEDPTEEELAAGKFPWLFYFDQRRLMLGDVRRCKAYPSGLSGVLQIPTTLAGRAVYGIGERAFRECTGLTSVKIPKGIRYVGNEAFLECRGLTSVEIPVGVTEFASSAFNGCDNIISATLPGCNEKIYYYLPCVDRLRFLTVADGSTIVGENQFCGCSSLVSVSFPATLRSIGSCAFQGCYEIKTLSLPLGLQEVGEAAFDGCDGIKSLKVPGSLSVIGRAAFRGLREMLTLELGEGVCVIDEEAFDCCDHLKTVTFPSSLLSVGYCAFRGCCQVETLLLPDGLADVDETAFEGCDRVSLLHVPGSLSVLKAGTFRNLENLKVLTFGEGVCVIGDEVFRECRNLQSVVLPTSLVSIGDRAFQCCESLKVIELPEGLSHVGEEAFADCGEVEVLTIPGSLSYINDRAFRYMKGLKTLVLNEGVVGIGEEAFCDCHELTKISFPYTLRFIDRNAFDWGCGNLAELELPEGLLMVADCAFSCTRDDMTIYIPSTLVYVGNGAFSVGCNAAVRVAPGDVERVSALFEGAGINFEKGQIVEVGQLTNREQEALATQLATETFTTSFMQSFAALAPGETTVVSIPNAQPGLNYAIAVSATVEGLSQAARDAPRVAATSEGVEIKVTKPAGDSAFFLMVVVQP